MVFNKGIDRQMEKQRSLMLITVYLMACLLSCALVSLFLTHLCAQRQYLTLSELARNLAAEYPQEEQEILRLIKAGGSLSGSAAHSSDYLSSYGFRPGDFSRDAGKGAVLLALLCASVFLLLFILLLITLKKIRRERIRDLTRYLLTVNLGKEPAVLPSAEDDFSPLKDEIYKTVTALRTLQENALRERNNFADRLADISHQIKTPVTSLSSTVQLLKEDPDSKTAYFAQIRRQLERLNQLIESLLTLSRLDSGVLKLEKRQVDIYTALQLSVDAIDDILRARNIRVNVPNHPELCFTGDMEWSVEALINLLKNCAQHTPDQGEIFVDYSQNPLYTEIVIKDSGEGFAEKDLPHLFERFYRGEGTTAPGLGIGLSLSKSIIEMQNGFVSARNLPEGGACFSIRFYISYTASRGA